jgi:predicted acetyltransferase
MTTDKREDQADARARTFVELVDVSPSQISVLRNLYQFYEYDFTEIEPANVGEDGRFHQLDGLKFDHGYFIRVANDLAGFALVSRKPSRIVPGETVWWVVEFFVMRRYRRTGAGRRAAELVITRHPGTWEVTQTPRNEAALMFWRKTLAPYKYHEIEIQDAKWGLRPLQRFSTS